MSEPESKKSLEKYTPIPSNACVKGYKVYVYFWKLFLFWI